MTNTTIEGPSSPAESPVSQNHSAQVRDSGSNVALCWGLIALAVALRLVRYLHDRGLWLDEVYLALNLVNRSFAELTVELDDEQYAPFGFLFLMKLCVTMLGKSEYVFRLVPLLASFASAYLFYRLARRVLTASAVPLALGFFAISFPLLVYSAEAKQYGVDAAIALGLTLLGSVYTARNPLRPLDAAVLAITGASSVWLSHPAAFVLAGMGLVLGAESLRRRDWRRTGILATVVAIWLASFAGLASLVVGAQEPQLPSADLGHLREYYSNDFLPWPPYPLAVTEWLMYFFPSLLGQFTSEVAAGIAVVAFVMGCIPLGKHKRREFAMLTIPLAVALLVSAAHFYPTRDRFMLFIGPGMLLVIAAGFDEVRARVGVHGRIVWIVLLVAMTFQPALRAVKQSISPERHGDSRAAVARLDANFRDGDFIYLHWTASPQYRFYSKKTQPHENVLAGTRSERWEVIVRDLEQLFGKSRVWVLFSFNAHTTPAGRFVRDSLDSKGRLVDTFESERTALYLYDLSGNSNRSAP